MALIDDLIKRIKELEQRIKTLESSNQSKNIKIPAGGKLVVNSESADPSVENGKIYYNTTTNKLRKCTNGVWSDI